MHSKTEITIKDDCIVLVLSKYSLFDKFKVIFAVIFGLSVTIMGKPVISID